MKSHLPKNAGTGGRWKSHRKVINGTVNFDRVSDGQEGKIPPEAYLWRVEAALHSWIQKRRAAIVFVII